MLPKLAAGSRAAALTIGRALTAAPITPLAAEDLRVDEDVTLVKYRSETIQGLKIAYREAAILTTRPCCCTVSRRLHTCSGACSRGLPTPGM
jgi:hypothetical protein